jgi:hypothetical protein
MDIWLVEGCADSDPGTRRLHCLEDCLGGGGGPWLRCIKMSGTAEDEIYITSLHSDAPISCLRFQHS